MGQVASTSKPLIIYLPDPRTWFERAVSLEQRQEFLIQVEHKLDQLVGPVVIIVGWANDEDSDMDDRTRLVTVPIPSCHSLVKWGLIQIRLFTGGGCI